MKFAHQRLSAIQINLIGRGPLLEALEAREGVGLGRHEERARGHEVEAQREVGEARAQVRLRLNLVEDCPVVEVDLAETQ